MGSRKWDIVDIDTEEGRVSGVAPVIISASRNILHSIRHV